MGRPERPLDPASGPVAAFAIALRELRRAAGGPSYRELSKRALFSPSVLSAATSGFSLPTLRVTLAFVEACGADPADWQRRWAEAARAAGVVVDQEVLPRPRPAAEAMPVLSGVDPCWPTPAQLPAGSRHFAGRRRAIAALNALTGANAPVLISGPVGVGKSALAIHWSHQSRARFPDGVLYADLCAHASSGTSPPQVLADFLCALGTPAELIPAGEAQRAALYRSMLAERDVLVVLDNAVDEGQLRLLLAEAPGSQVLVTSRGRLAGLDGVERITLDTLPPDQSLALLSAIIGAERIEAERAHALELADLCDHLPLALRVVAVRIAVRPGWTLAHAVAHLRDEPRRLDQLRTGDVDLRDRLRTAWRSLDATGRRAFGCLARLDGDIDAHRLAEVLDEPVHAAEEVMETLVDVGLIQPTSTVGAYRLPWLFRLYALEEDADDLRAGCVPVSVR
jgi:hypothetical protein